MYNVYESDFYQLTVFIENIEFVLKMEFVEFIQNREFNSIINLSLIDIQLFLFGFKFCFRIIEWMFQYYLFIK